MRNIEVVVSDPIGSKYEEYEANSLKAAAIFSALNYVWEAVEGSFSFASFSVTFDSENVAKLTFSGFEGSDKITDPIYFQPIE